MLARVQAADGKISMPAMQLPDDIGFIAQFIDSEGNSIGLHSLNA
jgi:predicted enzyme related to lactoylglutathione lyase